MDLPDEIVCSILDWVIRELNGGSYLHIALVSRQFYRCVLPLALQTIVVYRPSSFPLSLLTDSNLPPHHFSDLVRRSIQDILVPQDSVLQGSHLSRFFLALRTLPNLHTLRLFSNWASWFSNGDWSPLSSPGSCCRPRRIITDVDLGVFLKTPGLKVFGDRLTHLWVDYYYALHDPHPRVTLPELTHLAVVVPAQRCRDWSTCIEEILNCFSHPSGTSSLELFLLILDERQDFVLDEKFFNSDAPSSLFERTAPKIVLGSVGSESVDPRRHRGMGEKIVLKDLRESYHDLQKPYPRYPDIWDRAQALRRRGSDS